MVRGVDGSRQDDSDDITHRHIRSDHRAVCAGAHRRARLCAQQLVESVDDPRRVGQLQVRVLVLSCEGFVVSNACTAIESNMQICKKRKQGVIFSEYKICAWRDCLRRFFDDTAVIRIVTTSTPELCCSNKNNSNGDFHCKMSKAGWFVTRSKRLSNARMFTVRIVFKKAAKRSNICYSNRNRTDCRVF